MQLLSVPYLSSKSHLNVLKLNSLAQCILLRQDYFVFSKSGFCLWFAKKVSAVELLHFFPWFFFFLRERFVSWKDVDRQLIMVSCWKRGSQIREGFGDSLNEIRELVSFGGGRFVGCLWCLFSHALWSAEGRVIPWERWTFITANWWMQ